MYVKSIILFTAVFTRLEEFSDVVNTGIQRAENYLLLYFLQSVLIN